MNLKYLFIPILSIFILTGCGEEKEKTPETEKDVFAYDTTLNVETEPVDNPDESFRLAYEYEKGNTYTYRLAVLSDNIQTFIADSTVSQTVNQELIYIIDITLDKVDDEKILEFSGNVTSTKLTANAGGQQYSFQSGTKLDSADTTRYADYIALTNTPFNFRVSNTGTIEEIFRTDKFVNKYLEIKGYQDSVTAQEKSQLQRELTDGIIKPILAQIFREIPEKDLAKDSTWQFTQSPMNFMVFRLTNTNAYKVESLEELDGDKVAVIDASLLTKIEGETEFTERGVSYDFEKPVTQTEGTVYFNIDKGFIQKSKVQLEININFSMEAQTQQGMQRGTQQEMIKNTNILELIDY